jgi:hypothetical protein
MKGKIDRHERAKTVLVINYLLRQEISKNASGLFGVSLFLTLFSMVLLFDVIPWSLLAPIGSNVSIGITSGVLVFGIIHYRLHKRNIRSAKVQFNDAGLPTQDEWEGGAGSRSYIPEFAKAMITPLWIKMLLTISILVLAAGLLTRFPVLKEILMTALGWIFGFMLVVIVAIALIVGFYGFMEYLFRESRIVKSVVGILIVSSLVGLAFIQNVPLIVRISAGVLVLTVLPFLVFWLYRAIEMRRLISNSKQYRECMKAGKFHRAFAHLNRAHCASCKYFDRIQSHVIFGEILEKQGKLDWANHFYRIAMSEGDTLEGGDLLSQREHQLLRKALTVEVLTSDPADLDSTVEDSSNESEDDTVDISVDASVDTDVDPRRIRLLIKRIMEEASLRKASHVYFEAEEDQLVLRYRVDGVCHIRDWLPKRLQKDLVDTLKYMAGVNLAVHNIPQHGVFVRTTDQKPTVVHLTTIPGEHGESIMLSMSSGPKCTLKGKALKDEGKRLDIPGAAKMKADDLRAAVALHL